MFIFRLVCTISLYKELELAGMGCGSQITEQICHRFENFEVCM